jgi:Mn2+/Fe2+ NRAMP family transporter
MKTDRYVGTFLAIGLFDAGLLGAICISLASSWAFGEIFGWAHSLNTKIRQAPWFYATYFLMLITSGLVVLIPQAPLVLITLFVQVIAVTLLPAALVFLILLLNDRTTMGERCNTLNAEPHRRLYCRVDHYPLDPVRRFRCCSPTCSNSEDADMSRVRNLFRQSSPRSIPGIASRALRCPERYDSRCWCCGCTCWRLVALMIYKFVLIVTQG